MYRWEGKDVVGTRLSCAAILCVRNEQLHLPRVLGQFIEAGIDVAIIDHGSNDNSLAICKRLLGRGVVSIDHLPWTGVYDQTAQLRAKAAVAARLNHDWLVHADADEWMHTQRAGESLLQGIERADAQGFTGINFEEFVFLPEPGSGQQGDLRLCNRYYFFAPCANRLMRAWRRDAELDNIHSGGHVLAGDGLRLFPETFVLRHYIVASQQQAIEKYVGRRFAHADLERGWHENRLGLTPANLLLPDPDVLCRLEHWRSARFDRTHPMTRHFWHWTADERQRGKPAADAVADAAPARIPKAG
jgi:hypothetical protein